MSELPEIEKDDWIVINDGRYSGDDYRACRVIKVTARKVIASDKGRSEARHFYKESVLFVGPESATKRVVEKLGSAVARHKAARKLLRQQHDARVLAIINTAGHCE